MKRDKVTVYETDPEVREGQARRDVFLEDGAFKHLRYVCVPKRCTKWGNSERS